VVPTNAKRRQQSRRFAFSAANRPPHCGVASARRLQLFIQELLHRLEQLKAVLFHDDGVRAFADFNVALVRYVGQLREVRMTKGMAPSMGDKNRIFPYAG